MFAQSGVGLGGELHILDFRLTDEEMAQIARLNKGVRYYTRTEEALARFASWKLA